MKARVPRGKSGRTALCGMLAAVSLALLWVAGMAPSGRLGLSALGGLGPVVAVLTAGRGARLSVLGRLRRAGPAADP